MRTVFIGGTKRGYLTLRSLIETKAEIVGIISLQQDGHEVERYEDKIRDLAQSAKIPIFETKMMRDRDYATIIKDELKADLGIAIGIRVLIPETVFNAPKMGTVAVHDSLLPEYRGFAPLNWAIINGEQETGVTLFYMDERMDGGDIVDQIAVPIGPSDSAPMVYEKICQSTIDLITRNYKLLSEGKSTRTAQNYNVGSFTCSRIPADGLIDWNAPTSRTYNLIRALTYPYPGAFTFFKNQKLFIWDAEPAHAQNYVARIPGRVVGVSKEHGWVEVLTGDGTIRLKTVQLEGQQPCPASSVITSVKVSLGLNMMDLWQKVVELEQAQSANSIASPVGAPPQHVQVNPATAALQRK